MCLYSPFAYMLPYKLIDNIKQQDEELLLKKRKKKQVQLFHISVENPYICYFLKLTSNQF